MQVNYTTGSLEKFLEFQLGRIKHVEVLNFFKHGLEKLPYFLKGENCSWILVWLKFVKKTELWDFFLYSDSSLCSLLKVLKTWRTWKVILCGSGCPCRHLAWKSRTGLNSFFVHLLMIKEKVFTGKKFHRCVKVSVKIQLKSIVSLKKCNTYCELERTQIITIFGGKAW